MPADLQRWCDLANVAEWMDVGTSDNCILTSHALAAYLRLIGRGPQLMRIEAHTFAKCRCGTECHGRNCHGSALGWDGCGERLPAAAPGMWRGHLAVACDGHLLDPTIDQVNNDLMHWEPLVFPLPQGWDDGATAYFADADGNSMWYVKYRRQVGWKSAPDARPSHWQPLVDLMVAIENGQFQP